MKIIQSLHKSLFGVVLSVILLGSTMIKRIHSFLVSMSSVTCSRRTENEFCVETDFVGHPNLLTQEAEDRN